MSDETMTTTYRGHNLVYYTRDDVWMAPLGIPVKMGSLPEVRAAIDQWEIDKQKAAGFRVWNLQLDDPRLWSVRDAVFRSGPGSGHQTGPNMILTRNFAGDPDSFYSIPRGDAAIDTPEVSEAIEAARKAYLEAIEAGRRWKEARRKIPRVSAEDWAKLPERE